MLTEAGIAFNCTDFLYQCLEQVMVQNVSLIDYSKAGILTFIHCQVISDINSGWFRTS
jgi:hypothetical protein